MSSTLSDKKFSLVWVDLLKLSVKFASVFDNFPTDSALLIYFSDKNFATYGDSVLTMFIF